MSSIKGLPDRIKHCSEMRIATGIFAIGAVEWALVSSIPASLPVWLPYEFSWAVFLTTAFTLAWFVRGYVLTALPQRPGRGRLLAFFVGIGLIYVSMQTYVDYAAQHMFFIHRLQHLVLHHTGPFLVALSNPADVIARGMPKPISQRLGASWVKRAMGVVQHPVVATILFVGLIYLWPAPPVHFFAMLDPRLYTVMNWSVTIDGILFWALIFDPRPAPVARLGYGSRALICIAIIPPQILLGAFLTFSTRDHFGVYAICGRIMEMTGLEDQQLAGIILWIPPSMMSVIGAIIVLNLLRLNDEWSEAQISNRSPANA